MMRLSTRNIGFALLGATVLAVVVGVLLPSPVLVDAGRVERGAMQVTVDEEGKTRIRDRYRITTPVTGQLTRVEWKEGDVVDAGQVVAYVRPAPLGTRARAEARARVEAARARLREAESRVEQAQIRYDEAGRAHERVEQVAAVGGVSREERERAENTATLRARAVDAAKFNAGAAASDLEMARAALLALQSEQGARARMKIPAPVGGRVLRVFERNVRVVPAGAPILEIGNPDALEVVIDVLSEDAVRIRAGTPVVIEGWGGEAPLPAVVRRVEPSAFTKVSALGVEEQRVHVIADLADPPASLGDGYRVEGRIVLWQRDGVLTVPSSALFRHGRGWRVFAIEEGVARRRDVRIGHRNAVRAEVLEGLTEGTQVVLHPANRVEDGMRVKPREPAL